MCVPLLLPLQLIALRPACRTLPLLLALRSARRLASACHTCACVSSVPLSSHCRQEFKAYRHEGRLVVATGSATGAYSPTNPAPTPSFALMDVDGGKVRPRAAHGRPPGARSCCAAAVVPHAPPTACLPPPASGLRQATVYVYELAGDQVKVDKLEYAKPSGGAAVL